MSTQTAGLFYPSEREIAKLKDKVAADAATSKAQVKVTAVSPGRGTANNINGAHVLFCSIL